MVTMAEKEAKTILEMVYVVLYRTNLKKLPNHPNSHSTTMNNTASTGGIVHCCRMAVVKVKEHTVELQWLEHLWSHENMFETGEVQANECQS